MLDAFDREFEVGQTVIPYYSIYPDRAARRVMRVDDGEVYLDAKGGGPTNAPIACPWVYIIVPEGLVPDHHYKNPREVVSV